MSVLGIVELVLWLLQIAAQYTKKTADDKIIREARAALAAVEKFRGTVVSKKQLTELRTEIRWPDLKG